MKKMIEVEYVGIEDVQEIMDDAFAVMQNTKHYVSVDMRNMASGGVYVDIYIMLDGFEKEKLFDYHFNFDIDDDENSVSMMNECKCTLKNLLTEE